MGKWAERLGQLLRVEDCHVCHWRLRGLLDVGELELLGEAVAFGQRAQFVSGGVLDLDAVGTAVLLVQMLDFAGIIAQPSPALPGNTFTLPWPSPA